ncbi:hypothetical protein FBQ82_21240 [Anaerolineae bacterium CFX7]|nr:hypothetical protein [Anaerolineae bacterium CFX7]
MAKQKTKTTGGAPLPTWVFLVGAIVLLTLAGVGIWTLLAPQTPSGSGPQLRVNQERIELGKQPFEKIVRAEFIVTNVGDSALTLDASAPVRALEGC